MTRLETTVSEGGFVTVPEAVRRRLDIEPGDKLRWDVDESGDLSVEIVRQRHGAFEGDDLKAPMGGDGIETHDIAGNEADSTLSEDS